MIRVFIMKKFKYNIFFHVYCTPFSLFVLGVYTITTGKCVQLNKKIDRLIYFIAKLIIKLKKNNNNISEDYIKYSSYFSSTNQYLKKQSHHNYINNIHQLLKSKYVKERSLNVH